MLKRLSRIARTSLVVSALVTVSAFFSIRVPHALVNSALHSISPQLELITGDINFCMSKGQLDLNSVVINFNDKPALSVKSALVSLGVSPLRDTFLLPTLIRVPSAELNIDSQLRQVLEDIQTDDGRVTALQLDINNIDIKYSDDLNDLVELKGLSINGVLDADKGNFKLRSYCVTPTAGDLQATFHTTDGNGNWQISAQVFGRLQKEWSVLEAVGLQFENASVNAKFTAAGDWDGFYSWRVDSDLNLENPRLSSPSLSFDHSHIDVNGSSASGIRINATTTLFENSVHSTGELSFDDHEGIDLQLEHVVRGITVNEQLRQWLNELEPEITTYLVATQASGTIDAQVLTDIHNNQFSWAIAIQPNDLNLAYQGLSTDGEQSFSFPYAMQLNDGYIAIADDALVFRTVGQHASGTVKLLGEVDFHPQETEVDLLITARDLPLEQEVMSALGGVPTVTSLISDLGNPHGGTANAAVHLFTNNDVFEYRVDLDIFNCITQPVMLPLNVEVSKAKVVITDYLTSFSAQATAARSKLNIRGKAHGYSNSDHLQFTVKAVGEGWHPDSYEAATMSGNLPIPAGLASFPIDGDFSYRLDLLWPTMDSDPQLNAQLFANSATVEWPQLGITLNELATHNAQLYAANNSFNFHVGSISTKVQDGLIVGQCNLSHIDDLNIATADLSRLPLSNKLISGSQQFAGQQAWGEHLDWNGAITGFVSFNPIRPQQFTSAIDLQPLAVNISDNPDDVFQLNGQLHLSPNAIRAGKLKISSKNSTLMVYNFGGELFGDRLHIEADLESNRGIELTSDLPALAGSGFATTLRDLGVTGKIKAESLHASADLFTDGKIKAEFTGGVEITDLQVSEGIPFKEGYAAFAINEAKWNSANDFTASMSITDGKGLLGQLAVSEVRTPEGAEVIINEKGIRVDKVEARLLDGNIAGDFAILPGDDIPYLLNMHLSSIDLGQMRNELDIRGALSGRVNGDIELRSTTTLPTDCTGKVDLSLEDAMLGSVPVLKSIWKISGFPAPVIDKGRLEVTLNGNGNMTVDNFSLDGTAFEFIGKGAATMDAAIDLKITVRTLSLITRLPLIKDILDVFIEQQIYGPIEDLQIKHRSWAKILNWFSDGEAFVPPPFPLWLPSPATPDWNISPIIPVQ